MSRDDVLLDYVKNELTRGTATDISGDDDLMGSGLIDSLGILQLIAFIEEQFNITVPDEDVVYENFSSVKAMTDYLAKF